MSDPPPAAASASAERLISPLVRAFLREEYAAVDAALPAIIDAVKATGAAECWHKHSSFLSHLQGVHRIASLWGMPRDVCLCALLHSAYSNRRACVRARDARVRCGCLFCLRRACAALGCASTAVQRAHACVRRQQRVRGAPARARALAVASFPRGRR
jgi:hypothetical protein